MAQGGGIRCGNTFRLRARQSLEPRGHPLLVMPPEDGASFHSESEIAPGEPQTFSHVNHGFVQANNAMLLRVQKSGEALLCLPADSRHMHINLDPIAGACLRIQARGWGRAKSNTRLLLGREMCYHRNYPFRCTPSWVAMERNKQKCRRVVKLAGRETDLVCR